MCPCGHACLFSDDRQRAIVSGRTLVGSRGSTCRLRLGHSGAFRPGHPGLHGGRRSGDHAAGRRSRWDPKLEIADALYEYAVIRGAVGAMLRARTQLTALQELHWRVAAAQSPRC